MLGRPGRNFAAGMSGGIAYVLDEDGTFATRCNTGMVELGPISNHDEIKQLHALIVRHHQYTEQARRAHPGRMGCLDKFVGDRLRAERSIWYDKVLPRPRCKRT